MPIYRCIFLLNTNTMTIIKTLRDIKRYVCAYTSIITGCGGWHKQEDELLYKYYTSDRSFRDTEVPPSVVFMIDGRAVHGGLTDRLCGICSVFTYCQQHGIPFHLHAVYPFRLQDCLEPNLYDWTIDESDIIYDFRYAMPVIINDYQFTPRLHETYLRHLLKHQRKQLHVYGDTPMLDKHFAEAFQTLFRPSAILQQAIDEQKQRIGSSYVAIVTRFQQLLGDFKETGYKTLSEVEGKDLIQRCIDKISELHETSYKERQVLCTSDSITFLQAVTNQLPYVHIIPGEVVHMDHTSGASMQVYLKSFVDMFMIAGADEVCLLQTGDMYLSNFPRRAAKLENKEFIHIKF